jgi:hypothetical protein
MVVRNQEKLLKKQFQQVLRFETMTSVEQEGEKDSPSTTANSIAAYDVSGTAAACLRRVS